MFNERNAHAFDCLVLPGFWLPESCMRYERSKRTRPAPERFASGLPGSGFSPPNCWAPPMISALMSSDLAALGVV